jgi:hypothetical protein
MSEIFTFYEKNNFVLTSGHFEPYVNETTNKLVKNFKFNTDNWKLRPKFDKKANGQAILTGRKSGITAIDIDDPTLEHNKKLMQMCEKECNLIQRTKKGYHYIFKYTDRIRTSSNDSIKIDVRNDNALLYVEPSNYTYKNNRYKYEFITLPTEEEDIKPITDEILNYYYSLFEIKDEKTLKIKESNKETNKELKNIKIDNTIDEPTIRIILDNLQTKRFDEYLNWIHLGIILKRCKISADIYNEYSKKSTKYKENEPYNIYNSIDPNKYDINLNTLYFWLKQDNKEKFTELIIKDDDEYKNMKETIENDYIIIGSNFYKRLNNRKGFHVLKENEIKLELKPYKIEVYDDQKNKKVKTDFYNKWIEDKGHYKFVDFIPNIKECPENTFNLFDGFEAEKHIHLIQNFSEEQILKKIDVFLKHIKVLTNNESEYFIKWLSHIIQKPYLKEGTTPLFRDKGQFLTCGGGTGKNLFFDNFGEKLLGAKYYLTIGTNNELYGSFNEHLENKLLVCIEEAQGKSNFENFDRLKSIITQSKTTINRKFVSKYQINDYSRYIFCSNNENPIPIDNNDRRFFCYDVNNKKRGDQDYFKKLSAAFDDNVAIACFYKYLLNYTSYDDPIEFQINRPITKCYVELKRINAPLIVKWLISNIKKKINNIYKSVAEVFQEFNDWSEETRQKKQDMTLSAFSRFLSSENGIFNSEAVEKNKASIMMYKLNYIKIKEQLKEKNYYDEAIENGFLD